MLRINFVDDLANADNFAKEKAKSTFHRVLVEQVQPKFMQRDEALELLEEHITNNILKVFVPQEMLLRYRWVNNSIVKRLAFLRGQWCRPYSVTFSTQI